MEIKVVHQIMEWNEDCSDKIKKELTEKKGLLDRIKALFASDVFDADEQEALAEKPAKTADTDADEVDTSEDEQIDEQMFDHDSADTDELVSEAIAAINEEPVISADETAPAAEAEASAAEASAEALRSEMNLFLRRCRQQSDLPAESMQNMRPYSPGNRNAAEHSHVLHGTIHTPCPWQDSQRHQYTRSRRNTDGQDSLLHTYW